MKSYLNILTITLLSSILLSACSSGEIVESNKTNNEKIPRKIEKFIESDQTFVFGETQVDLTFNKLAVAQSKEIAYVSAQVNGTIKTIHAKIGSKVKEGTKLITLGDSLSSDISKIQSQGSNQAYEIAKNNLSLSDSNAENTIELAKLAVEQAEKSLKNAQKSKKNTEELFDEQIDSLEDNIEKLEDAYDIAKDAYYSAKDTLDMAYQSGDQNLIEESIKQVNQTKIAKNETESALENAESNLEQLKTTRDIQLDQLEFAIISANTQIESSKSQLEAASTGIEQQNLLSQSQVIQAQTANEIAQKNTEYLQIKSPISGTVTAITAKVGNIAGPGNPLITIEQTDKIVFKTSLSEFESQLVNSGDTVEIKTNNEEERFEGVITLLNPTLNPTSNKIDVEITPSKNKKIKAGTLSKIFFNPATENLNLIPLNSVIIKENLKFVKIIDEKSEIKLIKINTGDIIGSYIAVLDGIKPGAIIIKSGTTYLEEGNKVKIIVKDE